MTRSTFRPAGISLAVTVAFLLFAPVAGAEKIGMVAKGKKLAFDGPAAIDSGKRLTIENRTSPRTMGPHTFTLLSSSAQPKGRQEMRRCGKLQGVCGRVAEAHKVNPRTFKVGRQNVDSGLAGWDSPFTSGRDGDSWYTEKKGEKTSRRVTAKPGTTLSYFCVIHPSMRGKLKVE